MATTTLTSNTRDLMALLGPEALAKLARPLTDDEATRVDEALARHAGDSVAALNAGHLPADVQAEIRRVMAA